MTCEFFDYNRQTDVATPPRSMLGRVKKQIECSRSLEIFSTKKVKENKGDAVQLQLEFLLALAF